MDAIHVYLRLRGTTGNTLCPPGHEVMNQLVGDACSSLQEEISNRFGGGDLRGDSSVTQTASVKS